MDANQIVEILKNQKGRHVKVIWSRQAKTLMNCPFTVTKRTSAFVRAGIDYANLSSIKEEIELGLRGPVQKLPWGEWKDFPFTIQHGNTDYVRLYAPAFDNLVPQVEWTMNGVPCKREEIESWLVSSEKLRSDEEVPPKCFTVKAESIIEVDGQR